MNPALLRELEREIERAQREAAALIVTISAAAILADQCGASREMTAPLHDARCNAERAARRLATAIRAAREVAS